MGRRMSAGLERESGTTPVTSREGARAADWAAENRTSLMALWRVPVPITTTANLMVSVLICGVPALRAGGTAVELDA